MARPSQAQRLVEGHEVVLEGALGGGLGGGLGGEALDPSVANPFPPFFGGTVAAGFPSPADDFIEEYLDLNQLLVKHREATFFIRAAGYSMTGAGIYPGDILIVDRSLEPAHGKVVIAVVSGELVVKRLVIHKGVVILRSENPSYPDIHVNDELRVWGVVTSVIHKV